MDIFPISFRVLSISTLVTIIFVIWAEKAKFVSLKKHLGDDAIRHWLLVERLGKNGLELS